MALVLADRVRETTTTTGTGTVALAGPVSGFQGFSAAIGNANTTYYTIVDAATGAWEVGLGTYTSSGSTLARTTVFSSSNAGAAVNFAAGTKDVFVTQPAERALYLNGAGTGIDAGVASFTANGVVYASSTSALATGSALTFDGSVFNVAPATGVVAKTKQLVLSNFTGEGVGITFSRTSDDVEVNAIGTATSSWDMGLFARESIIFATGGNTTYSATTEKLRLTATSLYTASDVNVGFGTSSPTGYRLNVVAAFTTGIGGAYIEAGEFNQPIMVLNHTNPSVSANLFQVQKSGTGVLTLDSAGNLGLGVTPSASAFNTIEIGAIGTSILGLANEIDISTNAYYNSGAWRYAVTGYVAAQYQQAAGVHAWLTASSGTANNPISFTQAMTLKTNGNLGVGLTNAQARLDVNSGSITFAGRFLSTGANTYSATSSTSLVDATLQLIGGNAAGATTGIRLSQSGNYELFFGGVQESNGAGAFVWQGYSGSAYAERMRLDSAGNLGLGVTPSVNSLSGSGYRFLEVGSAPGAGLYCGGFEAFLTCNSYYNGGWKYANNALATQYGQSAGAHQWFTAPSGTAGNAISFTQAMTLDASGNLGVGRTDPSNFGKLAVSGTIASVSPDGQTQSVLLADNTGKIIVGGYNGSGTDYLAFNAGGGTERMRLNSAGNLGLGVTPSAWVPSGAGGPILQIQNAAFFGSASTTGVLNNAYYNAGFKYISSDYASWYEQIDSKHVWYTAPSGTAGDAISFTQAMTLTAAGALLVGATSPFNATADVGLFARSQASLSRVLIDNQNITGSSGFEMSAYGGGWSLEVPGSGTFVNPLLFKFGATERARITSGGDLVVGGTSALVSAANRGNITINGVSDSVLAFGVDGTNTSYLYNSSTNLEIAAVGNRYVRFTTNGNERARITSGGDLLVGTTSSVAAPANGLCTQNITGATQLNIGHGNGTSSGTEYLSFSYNAGTIGSITQSGTTAVLYNVTSDYRLKTVIGPVVDAGQRIDALQPVEYTWNSNGTRTRGFLAHQFQEVYAGSVSGTKDAVDAEGKPVYQAMQASTSEVIADLVAELKSLRARVAALESSTLQ